MIAFASMLTCAQGWPKFIMSQVQTTHGDDQSIIVSGYSPHTATLGDGTVVAVGGQYPFADNATVAITRAKAGSDWAVALRIPCWVQSATVTVSDGAATTATPCALFSVPGLHASDTSLTIVVDFVHAIEVVRGKWNKSPAAPEDVWSDIRPGSSARGAVEVHRGPLIFTFPVPGVVSTTVLNATSFGMVHKTAVAPDDTKTTLIALQNPTADTLTFSGWSPAPAIPFDRDSPPGSIRARACPTVDVNGQYAKGHAPDSPVALSLCKGPAMDVDLVPISHSYLRFTALPVLANATS